MDSNLIIAWELISKELPELVNDSNVTSSQPKIKIEEQEKVNETNPYL